jgi:NAD(P)-dependent dehydrogenase (short-subunit alcohol dehydrogenase family)
MACPTSSAPRAWHAAHVDGSFAVGNVATRRTVACAAGPGVRSDPRLPSGAVSGYEEPAMRIVITGTNRGIGLELTRQYLARGDTVDAAVRFPSQATALNALIAVAGGRLRVHACDVTSDTGVYAFGHALERADTAGIDLLINNAGVMGKMTSLEDLDVADLHTTFEVNAIGPLRVARALLPLVLRSQRKTIVHMTSRMGSIADNTSGGAYAYRMSKAALNMACRSMALDLADRGVITAVFHPGWVQTDMGGLHAPTPVDASSRGLIAQFDALTPEKSGRFWSFEGTEIPW